MSAARDPIRADVSRSRIGYYRSTRTLRCSTGSPETAIGRSSSCGGSRTRRTGFTLLEMLIAMSLMVIAMALTYMTFSTVIKAWQRGVALSESVNHGDFVMDQMVAGLRSAYFPNSAVESDQYGFVLEDNGNGSRARDEVSWVKLGRALMSDDAEYADGPHRVKVSLEPSGRRGGGKALAVRGWRAYGEPDDFEADDVDPEFLTTRVVGLSCRIATNMVNGEVEWEEDWEPSNRIPAAVEVTLYLAPLESGEKPVAIRRAVGLPVAPLSWKF